MRKVILNLGWDMDRATAFGIAGSVFARMETAPCRPMPDHPIVYVQGNIQTVYKITPAGTHVLTITSK